MIKATGKGPTGKHTLFIGLSFGNLDKLRAGPLNSFITISGEEMGVPFDVMIFSGRDESEMFDLVARDVVPGAKAQVSVRRKS